MKIVFNIKEDDARNPGVIADCTGDNAGDSVGPTADGFETYGVTGVALITFVLVALPNGPLSIFSGTTVQDQSEYLQVILLVWLFAMRIIMIVASVFSYLLNEAVTASKYKNADTMNFEHPLTNLVWLTSIVSVALTFLVSYLLVGSGPSPLPQTLWWKLAGIISCGTLAGAIIPELVKVFTSVNSGHVRETVTASKEGGPRVEGDDPRSRERHREAAGYRRFAGPSVAVHVVRRLGCGLARRVRLVGGRGGVRVRSRRVRLPGHGPGDDRGRLVRSGHR
jgi:K(+)-stimulated pyrophosphate-energized sodium pump